MYEYDLNYCPVCEDEYRADIKHCGVCGAQLLTGKEMVERTGAGAAKRDARKAEITADDDLVVVRRGPLAEMKAFERMLVAENIGVLLAGDEGSCGKGCCGGGTLDLVVKREDAPDAIQLIDEEIKRTSVGVEDASHADAVVDMGADEATCPACGHVFKTAPECPDCGLSFQVFLT